MFFWKTNQILSLIIVTPLSASQNAPRKVDMVLNNFIIFFWQLQYYSTTHSQLLCVLLLINYYCSRTFGTAGIPCPDVTKCFLRVSVSSLSEILPVFFLNLVVNFMASALMIRIFLLFFPHIVMMSRTTVCFGNVCTRKYNNNNNGETQQQVILDMPYRGVHYS